MEKGENGAPAMATTSMMEVEVEEVEEEQVNPCLSMMTDRGSVESHRYYLARRTLLEMLWDRGYAVSVSDIDMSLADFRRTFSQIPDLDRLRISSTLLRDPSKKILGIFCGVNQVKLKDMQDIRKQYANEHLSRMIIVLQGNLASQTREKMKDLFPFKVETFQITDLLVNITKHVLKPKHEILSEEEKQKLLKKYNVEDRQLPRMLESDAIARYYGLEKGKVLKITYDGEITGSHVTYRCII